MSLHWLPACAAVQPPVFVRHSWSSGTGSEDDPTPAKLSATSEEPVLSPKDTKKQTEVKHTMIVAFHD